MRTTLALFGSALGLMAWSFIVQGPAEPDSTEPRPLAASEAAPRPLSLAVVVDRSASMQGRPLEEARAQVRAAAASLGVGDRMALLSFGREAQTELALAAPGELDVRLEDALFDLRAAGATDWAAGLAAGIRALEGAPAHRVVRLISDGAPNTGLTQLPQLAAMARAASRRGIEIEVEHVGSGSGSELGRAFRQLVAASSASNPGDCPELLESPGAP